MSVIVELELSMGSKDSLVIKMNEGVILNGSFKLVEGFRYDRIYYDSNKNVTIFGSNGKIIFTVTTAPPSNGTFEIELNTSKTTKGEMRTPLATGTNKRVDIEENRVSKFKWDPTFGLKSVN